LASAELTLSKTNPEILIGTDDSGADTEEAEPKTDPSSRDSPNQYR
jgi:hypothetical protein